MHFNSQFSYQIESIDGRWWEVEFYSVEVSLLIDVKAEITVQEDETEIK